MSYYVICVYLCIVVSNIYCVVFLFCFIRHVYPMLPVPLDRPFLIAPSIYSNVYLVHKTCIWNNINQVRS